MKVIDCSPLTDRVSTSSPLASAVDRIRLGREWAKDMEAQEGVIFQFGQALDNQFTMLRNVKLEGLDVPIPLILLGPTGIWILYPSASRGVFRAKGEVWEKLDERLQLFKQVKPNPIARVALMAKAVSAFLAARGFSLPQLEPVLIFPDPGTHVEQVRPVVRIVLVDALDRFASGILQSRTVIDQDEIQKAIAILNSGAELEGGVLEGLRQTDAFSFVDDRNAGKRKETPAIVGASDEQMRKLSNKLPFSMKQLLILIGLIVVNIMILVAIAIFILVNL